MQLPFPCAPVCVCASLGTGVHVCVYMYVCVHVSVHMCGGVLVYMHMWKPEVPRLMSRITLNGSFNQGQSSQR